MTTRLKKVAKNICN